MRTRILSRNEKGAIARAKEADLARKPRLAARIALSLFAMTVGLILLAAKTQVPNITRAPGTILPYGNYYQVETLEGGVVIAIHVVEGQIVEAGAPLVELDQPDIRRRNATLRIQHDEQQARLMNLIALRMVLAASAPPTENSVADLREAGYNDSADKLQLHIETQKIKTQAIERQTETIDILNAALTFNEERVAAKMAQLQEAQILYDKGLTTVREYQVEDDQLNDQRQRANDARVELAKARNQVALAVADRQDSQLALQEDVLEDLLATRKNLMDLAAELAAIDARLADLSIVAPEAGIVQSVALPNLGEVIEPGETLFELVPQQRGLVIEARIPADDIGHVDTTQPVSISVDTFDPRRFGQLNGHLLSLSPVPLTDEATGEQYFRAAIALESTRVGQSGMKRQLRTGMTVVAEIVTGEQTMLAYFLKPIDSTLNRSFRER
ncbi:HlyD family type I secretion periplasmic adaptor subunit [Aliiroseovarius sp. 2305UL8-7]|uniref:HlyD family type I secretion periplasmic adaptor subunit n=1 Tax=Aliiroseovarius conchicola TaxID=3121637 RepID=UPI003528E8E3